MGRYPISLLLGEIIKLLFPTIVIYCGWKHLYELMSKYKYPIILISFGIIFSLFSAFASYYYNNDWFMRSGSILTFVSIVSHFLLTNIKRNEVIQLFESDLDINKKVEKVRRKDRYYKILYNLSFIIGLIGTIIWGYGDLII